MMILLKNKNKSLKIVIYTIKDYFLFYLGSLVYVDNIHKITSNLKENLIINKHKMFNSYSEY